MKKTITGFTVIELVIIISIISILTVVGSVSYEKVQTNARDADRSSKISVISTYLEKYYLNNGEYPGCSGVMDQAPTTVVSNTLKGMDPTNLAVPGAVDGTNSIVCSDTSSDAFVYLGNSSFYILKYKSESSGSLVSVMSQKQPHILISVAGAGGGGDGGAIGYGDATGGSPGGNSVVTDTTNSKTYTAYGGGNGTGVSTPAGFKNSASDINSGGSTGGAGGAGIWCNDGGNGANGALIQGSLLLKSSISFQINVGAGGPGGAGDSIQNDCSDYGNPDGSPGINGVVAISVPIGISVTATNATESTNSDYTVYTFNSNGTLSINL
jgi:Tfp pilus assembly major pilin PilA